MNLTKNNMISYCITVCNEASELRLLLNQLYPALRTGDEILIQGDQGNVTSDVVSVISPFLKKDSVSYIEYPLNSDFATYKNNLIKHAKNGWIFQIDADELVSETFLNEIHWILGNNHDVNGYAVPRVNIVEGLTQEWINAWGWRVTVEPVHAEDSSTINVLSNYKSINLKKGIKLVNYPDYQCRIFRADKGIHWVNKVHEVLKSSMNVENISMPLPCSLDGKTVSYDYCLFHVKQLDRQIRQNEMYSKIV